MNNSYKLIKFIITLVKHLFAESDTNSFAVEQSAIDL